MASLFDFLDVLVLGRDVEFVVLLFTRLLPIVVFTPLFGGANASRRFRIGLTVVLTLVLLPNYALGQPVPGTDGAFLRLLVLEALIGISIAVAVMIVFEMLAATGAVVDLSRGATIANVISPLTMQRTSVSATFLMQVFVVVFVSAGGLRLFIRGLASSLALLPPGSALPDRFRGAGGVLAFANLFGDLFAMAVQMAMPVVLVVLIVDTSLGLLNRVTPRIQAYFMGLTIKATLGILILFLVFGLLIRVGLAAIVKHLNPWLLGG